MEQREDYVVFIGGPCIDEYYTVEHWPREGDKFVGRFAGNVPGGMIANAACVFAGYGPKTYCFYGMGRGGTTDFLLDDLRAHGVDVSRMILLEDHHDGKCVIFQSRADRTILVVEGEERRLRLEEEQRRFLNGAGFVYTTLQCMERFEDAPGLFCEMKAHGVKIVLDNEPSTYVEGWEKYMRHVHTAFFNEHSLALFQAGGSEDELLLRLFGMGVQIVVETLGKEGCAVVTRQGRFAVPAYDVPVVDTTGAGDTFNSSFVFGLSRGWGLRESAGFATAAANMAVMAQGPRSGITSEENVRDFMRQNADLLGEEALCTDQQRR